ncbi:hypothetical protein M422DRAFT_243902 [Sphaerobolus stellatus SS14]|nr:hypothetical protein M422DRAFT_243902 [Sphaerobolus stellatus SS14]
MFGVREPLVQAPGLHFNTGQQDPGVRDPDRRIETQADSEPQLIKESTLSFKVALSFLQTHLALSFLDEDTTKALDHLANLETIKQHMESSQDMLKAVESWSTMEPEVTTLLAELQYAKAAKQLAEV